MYQCYKFFGKLIQPPFPLRLTKTINPHLQLHTENDFERVQEFNVTTDLPILVNFHEHYQILESIINAAFDLLCDMRFVIVRMLTTNIRLPKVFLDPRVLLTVDVFDEISKLVKHKIPCLGVQDTLIRHRNEHGQNDINIEYYTPSNMKEKEFTKLVTVVKNFGFVTVS
jgi:hypothetical protein